LLLTAKSVIEWRNEGCILPPTGKPQDYDDQCTFASWHAEFAYGACAYHRGSRAGLGRAKPKCAGRRRLDIFKRIIGCADAECPEGQAESLGQDVREGWQQVTDSRNREQGGAGRANGEDSSGVCGIERVAADGAAVGNAADAVRICRGIKVRESA
jgi:hypothetical protein